MKIPIKRLNQPVGWKRSYTLIILVLIGLIHGLLYTFLVPPWQHYDEPGHFEYAWLIANQDKRPEPGEYNQSMRREVAASMIEHHFFSNSTPDLGLLNPEKGEPIWIGISQVSDPPFYYWLASIPLFLLRSTDVTIQLYSVRLVSLCLYLITIVAAWGIAHELFSRTNPLSWIIPATLVLLPGFTELMTAINNDVGATMVFSLFLWGCLRLLNRGFSWPIFLWVVITAGISYLTKSTIYIAIPLALTILLFVALPGKLRWIAYGFLVFSLIFVGSISFIRDDPAFWWRLTTPNTSARVADPDAPLGSYSLQITPNPYTGNPQIAQPVPYDKGKELAGKTITLGAWIWANRPSNINRPFLSFSDDWLYPQETIHIGKKPEFFTWTIRVPKKASKIQILLSPYTNRTIEGATIFYDGIVLIPGKSPSKQPPRFNDIFGDSLNWGGKTYKNIARNASGEILWPRVHPRLNELGKLFFPGQITLTVASIMDRAGTYGYYRTSSINLFYSFWAKFGWGHVYLRDQKIYLLLGLVTLIGGIGAVWSVWNKRKFLPWFALIICFLASVGIWGMAIVRGIDTLFGHTFIPSARYAYPAIIPTILFLTMGWMEVLCRIFQHLRLSERFIYVIYSLAFFCLDLYALYSLTNFYTWR